MLELLNIPLFSLHILELLNIPLFSLHIQALPGFEVGICGNFLPVLLRLGLFSLCDL